MSQPRFSQLLFPCAVAILYCYLFFHIEHSRWYPYRSANFAWRTSTIDSISGGGIVRPLAYLTVGVSGLLFLRKQKRTAFTLRQNSFSVVILFFTWAWLSYFWADDSYLVLKRLISFTCLIVAAFGISRAIEKRHFLLIVWVMSSLFLAGGFVSEWKLGTFNPFREGYRFMGTLHPEGQGFNCALLLLSSVALSDTRLLSKRALFYLSAATAIIFLFFTRSRAPFAAVIVAYMVYFFFTRRGLLKAQVVFLVLLILGTSFLILGGAEVTGVLLLGRQGQVSSLSGRIPLWTECIKSFIKRPLTGYGFSGFWTQERAWEFSESLEWIIDNSHSIYMDTALNVGIVGLSLLVVLMLMAWLNGATSVRRDQDSLTAFLLALLVLMCADGFFSNLVMGGGFVTLVLFSVIFFLCFSRASAWQD